MPNEKYQEFLKALSNLKEKLTLFSSPDSFGDYPTLEEDDIRTLRALYAEAFAKASNYAQSVPPETPDHPVLSEEDKTQLEYCMLMQESLTRDGDSLETAVPGETLPDVFERAQVRTIDITGKILSTAGYVLSSRIRVEAVDDDGNPIRGFFTPRMTLDGKEELERIRKHYIHMYPDLEQQISLLCSKASDMNTSRAITNSLNSGMKVALEEYQESLSGQLDANEKMQRMNAVFTGMSRDFNRFTSTENNYREGMARDTSKAPIDTRNVAMSRVAHLLGCDGILAKSSPMQLYNDGYIQEGSFIEFADGIDPLHLAPDSPLLNIKEDAFDHSPVLRQLSDMNVLDFICQNLDRHKYNMMYQVDNTDPAHPKITGIVGIDNDMSFNSSSSEEKSYKQEDIGRSLRHAGLKAINNMSESMKQRIQNLDDSVFMHSLYGTGLTKENIEPALERLHALQKKIRDNEVTIIPDERFVDYTFAQLTLPSHRGYGFSMSSRSDENVFTNAFDIVRVAQSGELKSNIEKPRPTENTAEIRFNELVKKYNEETNEKKKRFYLRELRDLKQQAADFRRKAEHQQRIAEQGPMTQYHDGIDRSTITSDTYPLRNIKRRLFIATQHVYKGSPQYDNACTAIDNMIAFTEQYEKSTEKPVKENDLIELRQKYADTYRVCEQYIRHKMEDGNINAGPHTKPGKRIAAVRAAMKFCVNRVNALNDVLEPYEKDERHEMKAEAGRINEETYGRMSPAELGTYLKSLNKMAGDGSVHTPQAVSQLGGQIEEVSRYILRSQNIGRIDPDTNKLTQHSLDEFGLTRKDLLEARSNIEAGRKANAAKQNDTDSAHYQNRPEILKKGPGI